MEYYSLSSCLSVLDFPMQSLCLGVCLFSFSFLSFLCKIQRITLKKIQANTYPRHEESRKYDFLFYFIPFLPPYLCTFLGIFSAKVFGLGTSLDCSN